MSSQFNFPYRAETRLVEKKSQNRVIIAKLATVNVLEQFSYDTE